MEAYVSTHSDGVFELLDLNDKAKDVIMKYTQKDLQDISKVFAPYSLDFTLPPSDKNKVILDWFGYNDSSITHASKDFKFPIKIYINSFLHLQGFLKCKGLTTAGEFNVQFNTGMSSLKDRLGEDLISNLPFEKIVSWKGADLISYMSAVQQFDIDGLNIKWFVPFSSNSRVWVYDNTKPTNTANNIAYLDSNYNKDVAINTEELSPAMSYYSLLKAIIKYYKLDVFLSPAIEPMLKDVYLSCTGQKIVNSDFQVLKIWNAYTSDSYNFNGLNYYPNTYHTSGGTYVNPFLRIDQRDLAIDGISTALNNYCSVIVRLNGVITDETNNISIQLKRPSDGLLISEPITVKVNSGVVEVELRVLQDTFKTKGENIISGWKSLYYNVELKSEQKISWDSCDQIFSYVYNVMGMGAGAEIKYSSLNNNNFPNVSTSFSRLNIFKSLPKMKVTDFLTNFFKMCNISIYDNDPLNDKLQWLTPSDINTIGKEYSKIEVDYTEFVIAKMPKKNKEDDYDAYTFKYFDSKLYANVQFQQAYGTTFGDLYYPTLAERAVKKPTKELKIESTHSITGNIGVSGMPDVFTFYGFDSSFKPVEESVLFFVSTSNNNVVIKDISTTPVAIQNLLTDGSKQSLPLKYYIPTNVDRVVNGAYKESLTWGGTTTSTKSLYKIGYESFVNRLLDFKALTHKFKLQLPLSEIYLNTRFAEVTPYGWRLQNDIIIEENRYSIIDAEMNIENGMLNLSLYNYTIDNNGLVIPPSKQYKINQYKNNQYL